MIRYIEEHQVFILETKSTQYAMCVRPDGHLEHLYYGWQESGLRRSEYCGTLGCGT